MNTTPYLPQFQQAADKLNKKLLAQKQLDVETGVWLNSVVLKMHKKHWANNPAAKPQPGPAIFFSIWINESDAIKGHKLFYNIHALKLRQLKGYSITSREFASAFRQQFKSFEHQWPNVSTKFGPLTLMQGWKTVDLKPITEDIFEIACKFLDIDILIDTLLNDRKS